MSEQENFDDLIRQKFAEKEFVFNEENWERAEGKIDSVRRFSKISWWTVIFIIGLISGVGLTLLFVNKNSEKTKNISEINQQKDNTSEKLSRNNSYLEKQKSSLSSNEQNANSLSQKEAEEMTPLETEGAPKTNDDHKIETNSNSNDLPSESSSNKKEVFFKEPNRETITGKKENKISQGGNKVIVDNGTLLKKQIREKELRDTEPLVYNKASKFPQTNLLENGLEKSFEKNIPSSNQIVEPDKSTEQPQNVVSEEIVQNGKTKADNEINSAKLELNSQKNSAETTFSQIVQQDKTIAISQDTASVLIQNAEKKSDSEINKTELSEKLLVVNDSISQKLDSAIVSQQNNLIPPPAVVGGLASATFFAIEAGTNFEIGWKYPHTSEGFGINPVLGIEITHYFNQKWSLCSGVQYGSISNLKASQKTFSSATYSFGSITVDKVIDTKLLHYSIVPIMLQYHFNDKNAIIFGGSISLLMNSKSKVTTITTTISPMPLDSNQTGSIPIQSSSAEKIETGYYTNAFNKWDASLAIGYRRRISQKFSVGAIANFGLLDVKNNEFFLQENFERNIGLKITISYNFLDF